jgi:hypothetical protein
MKDKIGRNNSCWCGSGLKYKKCHLNRQHEPRPTIEESKKVFKKIFDKKYCIHPEAASNKCHGKIVKAHTIQRGGGLTRIAENKHVCRFMPKFSYSPPSYYFEVEDIGINEASTFTGFCEVHDNNTFERLEKSPFEASVDQIFLLAYRALSRGVFIKRNQLELVAYMRDKDKGLNLQTQRDFQEFIIPFGYGVVLGTSIVNKQKAKYDQILLNHDFSNMIYYVVLLDNTPEFLCSGMSILDTDFLGNKYNQFNINDINQEIVTFSIIPTDKGGAVIFASMDTGNNIRSFFSSIVSLDKDSLPNAIARYTFEYYENTFISPTWWKSLHKDIQQSIIRRLSSGVWPGDIHRSNCLLDDGVKIVTWKISNIITKLS